MNRPSWIGRTSLVTAALLFVAGCAATYAPQRLATPEELREVQSKTIGDVTLSVSILTDEHALQHFGVDLGKRDL